MDDAVAVLPHVNAALNTVATVLLIVGFVFIKRGRELAHKRTMLSCFGVSVVFFASYVVYHWLAGSKKFPGDAPTGVRYFYYGVLLTHVVLAASVPFLALATIYLGLRDRRAGHRRVARWTFPIWLYVSVTGVVVYLMLYQLYAHAAGAPIMQR
jgi:uncharacterized membrane protein YozB (DUF420 family)